MTHKLIMAAEGKAVDENNYKADSQFSSHLQKSEGQSTFARTRTLREQREYLPAFAVREQLMSHIRDHQGEPFRNAMMILLISQSSSLSARPVQARPRSLDSSCTKRDTAAQARSAAPSLEEWRLCPLPSVSARRCSVSLAGWSDTPSDSRT